MSRHLPVLLFCLCVGIGLLGILGSLSPFLSAAEENLGLHVLYLLRGPRKPPAGVVVVAIDRESSHSLHLPTAPHKWPRTLHARLLERLKAQEAALVCFDLIFYEQQDPNADQAFATAIRKAGNVVLTQTIDRRTMSVKGTNGGPAAQVNIEKLVSAIPLIAEAAAAQAPFPLPKLPVALNQYWRFRPGSGDIPTLPVVTLHAYSREAFGTFLRLVQKIDPDGTDLMPDVQSGRLSIRQIIGAIPSLHVLFENKPDLASRMLTNLEVQPPGNISAHTMGLVKSLINVYRPGSSRYLNLYGPPGSITTISYHRALEPPSPGVTTMAGSFWKGKAVFVGQTESDWYKANDGFYTPFTEKSGLDISGVEIAATAFANLLENKAVHPLERMSEYALLLGWGILCTLIGFQFSAPVSAIGLVLLDAIYVGSAYLEFKVNGSWYPLVVPILVQTPVAFIAALICKYAEANAERRNIREAFGHYLPDEVVDRLAVNVKSLRTGGKVLYGICLFTDAESYTTLSETMDPERLTRVMNAYYGAIFKPIKENAGIILQVVGDSVLAIWTAPEPRNALKAAACRAALQITESVRQFNSEADHPPLPTRIGIHAGEILLGNIGAYDHFEYRPVGDIVNTASRLEGLNKFLGTRMLTSEEAFFPDHSYSTRPVGQFVFKGKSRPVRVREILPGSGSAPEFQVSVGSVFASGLQSFERRRWDEAEKNFRSVLQTRENDGPSRFYLQQCEEFRQAPPDSDWDGTVHLEKK
jgi:adenylate cyclase